MRYFLSIPFILSFLFAFAADNEEPVLLKLSTPKNYDVSGQLYRYTEGSSKVTAQLAYRFFEAGKFKRIAKTNNEYINDGLVNKESWIALYIENKRSYESSMVLAFILSGVNSIECYTINDQQKIQPLMEAKNDSTSSVTGLLAKSKTININVSSGEKIILLMHIVNKGQLLYIPTRLYDLSYFREFDNDKNTFFGIFQGIFFFIIIFNLLLYLTTFDKIYLLYLFYALFISLFALNEVGTAAKSLAFLPFVNYFSGQTFLFAGFSIWLLLMLQFLDVTKNKTVLYRSTIAFVIVDILFAFLPNILIRTSLNAADSFQRFYQSSITFLFATNLLFIVIANIIRIVKGSKLAIFYTIANVPVILGAIIYYSNYYSITTIAFGWLNPVAFGLSIETFLISFGFAYRYNFINKEKRQLLVHLNEQQRDLASQILNTQVEEQKRIAADLHDELGGSLAAIKMTLQSFKLSNYQSETLNYLIDTASTSARHIAHNLMPPEFENTSLQTLLEKFYQRISADGKINFHFHSSGKNENFNKHEELIIYRIMMELTNNILKHSKASEATLQLIYGEKFLTMLAEDNGIGINKGDIVGIGLKNVRLRVQFLNGNINIDSSSIGTTVVIQIPFKSKEWKI
ncbi:MAG: 7TM diverse intracellular signaling domain-containing protein [Ferruginibacter sp.]